MGISTDLMSCLFANLKSIISFFQLLNHVFKMLYVVHFILLSSTLCTCPHSNEIVVCFAKCSTCKLYLLHGITTVVDVVRVDIVDG